MTRTDRVVVITGLGGMGESIARRIGSGATVLLADINRLRLKQVALDLTSEGFKVAEAETDVSDEASVERLAAAALDLGRPEVVVHTAGVSPAQASIEAILHVDLLGTALVLDVFSRAIASGGAGVVIASMAGTMAPPDPDRDRRMAATPTGKLLELPELSATALGDPGLAYVIAKRGNQVRVRAAASAWGLRNARVNSISPGVISTPMGSSELNSSHGEAMRAMIDASPTRRIGTPSDVAAVVEFLVSPQAGFITGTDILVDGGVVASLI